MIKWHFKEKVIYQDTEITQDSRKFEVLLEDYLREQYPLQNWKLTKATRDGNKDLESICEFSGTSMWAEAKYTIHTAKNISSTKYDSTLVSSIFEQNLIKVFFITNTSIDSNLIGRIKKFYYLSAVKQIAFVDGYNLMYWIKKHPEIEEKYFKMPVEYTIPSSPNVQLKCIRVLCKNDYYTIDSILEGEITYPLYLSKNYIIEGEFTAVGFDDTELNLFCNDILIFNGRVSPEITTFTIDINKMKEAFDVNKKYSLQLYYILDNKKYNCGEYHLTFAVMGELYQKQVQLYTTIEKGINFSYKKIYNIFGPQSTGKSLLLTNLKNDLLKKAKDNQRIIYVNFNGVDSDIVDICRIIFTLVFDYYNLDISATALAYYCNENKEKNSFLNPQIIEMIIQGLKDNDYTKVQSLLKGSIFSKTECIFQMKQSFALERLYFIDNIHRLNKDNFCILQAILNAFDPMKNISFILTGRTKIIGENIENVCLGYIDSTELLLAINERIPFSIDSLDEILPQKHYLAYPGLLHSFLQDIHKYTDIYDIKQYYMNSFHNTAQNYVKSDFTFDNIILLLICFVKEGIPMHLLETNNSVELSELLNKQFVLKKYEYIYPNFDRWNGRISPDKIDDHKEEIIEFIKHLMKHDSERKEIYQCSLMVHFLEYYKLYFNSIFERIKQKFQENRYSQVIFMCKSLLRKQEFDSDKSEILNYVKYYLAFSYMHCDASKDSQRTFKEITQSYQMTPKSALYFDAESEVIDAEYWKFKNFKGLPKHINKFRKNWKEASLEIHTLQIRAYLTATNRMMVTYLALDCMALANKWFKKNIKLATKFNASEHIGYTYMDYAKGIYHKNLPLALQYLQIADSYFQIPSEQRRHLDCVCEICYVKVLLGKGSIQQLLVAQEALFNHQFWIQYYKCHLKLAVCYILQGENENALKYLLEAEASAILKNNARVTYLCSIIETFLYKKLITYKNDALMGTSYQTIIDNMHFYNITKKAEIFVMGNHNNIFYIDPRVW